MAYRHHTDIAAAAAAVKRQDLVSLMSLMIVNDSNAALYTYLYYFPLSLSLSQVEAAAIPVVKDMSDKRHLHHHPHLHHQLQHQQQHHHRVGEWSCRHESTVDRSSGGCESAERSQQMQSLLFGGHASPNIDTPYQVTVKDNHDSCHAISMMKVSTTRALTFVRNCRHETHHLYLKKDLCLSSSLNCFISAA